VHGSYQKDDFEARIRIFGVAEGGRRSPAFNGIRWDFAYVEGQRPPGTMHMIWTDFLDDSGNSRSDERPLPVGEELSARMTIIVDEMRDQVHRARIAPGVRFYCHEGGNRVAEGVVTRVTGLFEPRPAPGD
jgi:translation elongation factor EF-Tu-like GTPase